MPFPDESMIAAVGAYRPEWPAEFEKLAAQLATAIGPHALSIDHVGSTSVPGLAAKNVIDIQVRMTTLDEQRDVNLLAAIGFRCRPEPWNRTEFSSGQTCRKLVFAPPVGARPCNVHLRGATGANARFALLFRDYLRANNDARDAWGEFKTALAGSVSDLLAYGQIKEPATRVVMAAAEQWAAATKWSQSAKV